MLFVATPPVFSYHSNYILSSHARAELIWCITMSESSLSTSAAFLCLACDCPVPATGGSALPSIWDSGTFVSLPSGVCEILGKMGNIAVLHDSSFDMALGYMAYCRSSDVNWLHCTCSWLLYGLGMDEW